MISRRGLGALTLLAALQPIRLRAQGKRPRIVGLLTVSAETDQTAQAWVAAFKATLRDSGWVEGSNIVIEVRWPAGDPSRMRLQAQEIAALQPDVFVSQGTPATLAAREAAPLVPNVFTVVGDPLFSGLAQRLSHPGWRSTGFTNYEPSLGAKWLGLLREIAPRCERFGIVANPRTVPDGFDWPLVKAIRTAAGELGVSTFDVELSTAATIDSVVAAAAADGRSGLIVIPETSTTLWADTIIAAASRHAIPTMYPYRDYVVRGGLIGYGVDRTDLYRNAAVYVDRILRGARPEDLPIQQPVKFEFAINIRAVKTLGLGISAAMLARADEVIE